MLQVAGSMICLHVETCAGCCCTPLPALPPPPAGRQWGAAGSAGNRCWAGRPGGLPWRLVVLALSLAGVIPACPTLLPTAAPAASKDAPHSPPILCPCQFGIVSWGMGCGGKDNTGRPLPLGLRTPGEPPSTAASCAWALLLPPLSQACAARIVHITEHCTAPSCPPLSPPSHLLGSQAPTPAWLPTLPGSVAPAGSCWPAGWAAVLLLRACRLRVCW